MGGRRSGRFPPSTQIVRKIRVHEKQLSSAPGRWKAIRALARALARAPRLENRVAGSQVQLAKWP